MLAMSTVVLAQSEGGLIVSLEAEKKIDRQWSVGVEADLRSRNDFKTIDRWGVGVNADFKFNKYLKLSAGYILLDNNFRESVSYNYNSDGSVKGYNNWCPSYWGVRHRFNASVTGTYKFGNNIRLSLRERWQYTYRPTANVERWDFDNSQWEDKTRGEKGKNQLRSRLQVEYDKKRARLTPYANVELYHAWAIEKIRYTIGTEMGLNKQFSLNVYYRFQDMKNVDWDDYDPDMHYLGLSLKYKF